MKLEKETKTLEEIATRLRLLDCVKTAAVFEPDEANQADGLTSPTLEVEIWNDDALKGAADFSFVDDPRLVCCGEGSGHFGPVRSFRLKM